MGESSYDVLPYEDYVFPETHPEHLHTVARYFGHDAPDFTRCRVLEIGCARGGNLLPMAVDLPESQFVGIDLSSRQIEDARAVVSRVGLRNVELRAASVTDIDASLGSFDFIVCHGVYSWVPPAVRAAILRACQALLTPNGVAYVSYNTLPGWTTPGTLRDLLLQRVPTPLGPFDRIVAARSTLRAFGNSIRSQRSPTADALRAEIASLEHVDDTYFFHEFLEEFNEPTYLVDFARAARAVGLAHLADARLHVAAIGASAEDGPHDGETSRDSIAREQLADFVSNRRFRMSLLVRDEPVRTIAHAPAALDSFRLSSRAELARSASESDLRSDRSLAFVVDGEKFSLHDPADKCALVTLVENVRRPVAYRDVVAQTSARARIDTVATELRLASGESLRALVHRGIVELNASPARYAARAGTHPVASVLVRDQARLGPCAANARHRLIDLEPLERKLLPLLDGTRDRDALAREVSANRAQCEQALEWLAMNALIVG